MSQSFVDLLADHDWSDMDIKNRTEAVIASEFPPVDYAILSRKVDGTRYGYVLTDDEQAQLNRYQVLSYEAGNLADEARADMECLRNAWIVEAAQAALTGLEDTPENAEARAQLQATLDAADPKTLMLVSVRAAARTPQVNQAVEEG